jgi:hypothetical protein
MLTNRDRTRPSTGYPLARLQGLEGELNGLSKRIEMNLKIVKEYEDMMAALKKEIKEKAELLSQYKLNYIVELTYFISL